MFPPPRLLVREEDLGEMPVDGAVHDFVFDWLQGRREHDCFVEDGRDGDDDLFCGEDAF